MRLFTSVFASFIALAASGAVWAHEFWIDPLSYQVQPGTPIEAKLIVGQEFNGSSYPYRPSQIARFDLVAGDTVTEVKARIGDNPALNMEAPAEGLIVVVHETEDSRLTYTEFAKFEKFVAHKDFEDAIALHDARGISREKFTESYRRYAKALIGVGDAQGADAPVGMRTEIVALANPYTEDLTQMPVQVLLDGAPRADAQVELFERNAQDEVTVTLHRTDADGKARVPVKKGHSYLVDAVVAEALPNDDPEQGPVWKTHWAALTFAVPE